MNLILDIFVLGLITYSIFLFFAYIAKQERFSKRFFNTISMIIIGATVIPILFIAI